MCCSCDTPKNVHFYLYVCASHEISCQCLDNIAVRCSLFFHNTVIQVYSQQSADFSNVFYSFSFWLPYKITKIVLLNLWRNGLEARCESDFTVRFQSPRQFDLSILKNNLFNFLLLLENLKFSFKNCLDYVLYHFINQTFNDRKNSANIKMRLIKFPLIIRFFQDKHIRNGKTTQNEDERSLGASVVMR